MIIENGDEYIAEVRELIIEYTNRLNRDLSFQGLDDDLNSLEVKYAIKESLLLKLFFSA